MASEKWNRVILQDNLLFDETMGSLGFRRISSHESRSISIGPEIRSTQLLKIVPERESIGRRNLSTLQDKR